MDCMPQIHTVAIHAEAGYNTSVPGLGVLCVTDSKENFVGAGSYRNSIGNASDYAVAGTYIFTISEIRYGIVGGLVTGYPDASRTHAQSHLQTSH